MHEMISTTRDFLDASRNYYISNDEAFIWSHQQKLKITYKMMRQVGAVHYFKLINSMIADRS